MLHINIVSILEHSNTIYIGPKHIAHILIQTMQLCLMVDFLINRFKIQGNILYRMFGDSGAVAKAVKECISHARDPEWAVVGRKLYHS